MVQIIGVRFRCAGKVYYFDPGEQEIKKGSKVIVETARGLEMGTVMLGNKMVEEETVVQPLKPVIRLATEEDFAVVAKNKEKEKSAFSICQEKIAKHGLEMKLVDVEYTFDNNKILFYFTADGRIDFRELVKDLASVFKTRIELRQIGVRDETKILGGIGICGRCLCCHSYLSEFAPVSIKMAKEQNLSLNPTKISGVCGRLMCCLKNEEDTYEYLNSRLPGIGDAVLHSGDSVRGTVQSVNVLRQTVKVIVNLDGDDVEVREYPIDELRFKPRRKKGKGGADKDDKDWDGGELDGAENGCPGNCCCENKNSERERPEKSGRGRENSEKEDPEKNARSQENSERNAQTKGGRSRENSERDGQQRGGREGSERDGQQRNMREREGADRDSQGKGSREGAGDGRQRGGRGRSEHAGRGRGGFDRGGRDRAASDRRNPEADGQTKGNPERRGRRNPGRSEQAANPPERKKDAPREGE